MGYKEKGGGSGGYEYWNVSMGLLKHKDGREIGGFEGIITGVRTKENEYDGRTSTHLQIRMEDPEDAKVPTVIIDGTLYYGTYDISTFGWMLLARLANPDNDLDKNTIVDIGIYGAGENKASCVAIRVLERNDKSLPGFSKQQLGGDDPRKFRSNVDRMLNKVINTYGTWEDKKQDTNGHDDGGYRDEEMTGLERHEAEHAHDDDLPF